MPPGFISGPQVLWSSYHAFANNLSRDLYTVPWLYQHFVKVTRLLPPVVEVPVIPDRQGLAPLIPLGPLVALTPG